MNQIIYLKERIKYLNELIEWLPLSKTGKHLLEIAKLEKELKLLTHND